jgi:protein SCO1
VCQQPSRAAALAWGCLVLMAGCRSSAKHYRLEGQALAKDQATRRVTVNTKDIPGFMPAMTMNYTVRDPQGLQQIEPGDRITADVAVNHGNYWLEHVTIVDRSERGAITGSRPPVLSPGAHVADVPLINQDGKIVHLSDFRGKAVLLTFIYTRCPFATFCPLITRQFAQIHNILADTPSIYQRTELVSVSLDPEFDTPPVLRKYGLTYLKNDPSGFAQWEFVSTTASNLERLASAFGLVYYKQDNLITHSMNTILFAPDGAVKQSWAGNDWTPSEILTAVKKLAL